MPPTLNSAHRCNNPLQWPQVASPASGQWRPVTDLLSAAHPRTIPRIFCSPGRGSGFAVRLLKSLKGNLLSCEKQVKILTLAINAYKLGNLSCFIVLSSAARQQWGLLKSKTREKEAFFFLIYQFLLEPFVLQASCHMSLLPLKALSLSLEKVLDTIWTR